MNDRIRALPTYPMVELERRKAELVAQGIAVFDFGTGDPREPTPEFVRRALADAVPEVSQYPSVQGTAEQRRAIAGYLRRRFGVEVDADREVLPTGGSKEAIFHLPMIALDPGRERDVVVYGEPAYPVFEIGALFAEAGVFAVQLTAERRYTMTPADVPAEVLARTAVVFLNYPHNPSGQELGDDAFRAWVDARDEHGFLLVSDECYCDVYFDAPPRSILEFSRRGCLAVHSLSKRSGMTGYRSGFVAGDAEWIAMLRRFRAGMGVATPVWTAAAAAAAWADDAHAAERRELFRAKRDVLLDAVAARGLRAYPGSSTLFLWVETPGGTDGAAYAAGLLEKGIVVSPGAFFGPGQERFVRLALVPTLEECREVAVRWPRA